ncbi:LLM class flavin-dependent oxidoreductase [Paenibacillus lautus]|uniref:LLM class flavin-dependent oxidoreductase n=1 Tax=Paenibacillus TaxID=44249 RepID=UPI000BBD898E|nr:MULTISPECIES: LLM class flavin-dependent oxidoreductase [Paenibacillus]MBY0160943.1 LLM class flavin-dependent oxidoreductase [Cytobacillus firmus]PCL91011.1 LLM class flavin-dependent oxidoreductase [Paenibacillus lautus]WFB57693.1 LLM class flavin-dependent oxidoreductase [Paenibacillus sp. BR1-192]
MNSQLKLSVLDLVPRWGESSFEEALQQAVILAQSAEQWGYGRYWAAEHHDLEHLSCASPEILLSHIGARTTRIRLGSGAVLLPHYSPLKVAENFRMLAALYPGRIDLGIGRAPGGSAHTSMALSGNFLGHVADLPQRIRALTELLEDRYRYDDVPVAAKPVPAAQPVMWMLGTNTKGAGYAAEFGTGYVFGQFMSDTDGAEILRSYREGFQPSADLREPRAMVAVSVICAETEEQARKLAALIPRPGESDLPSEPTDSDSSGPSRRLIIGTPASVRDKLQMMAEKYRCDEFLVVTPVSDYDARLESYRLLMGQ